MSDEYEKLRKKYWKLCGGKQLELAKEEREEFQAEIWRRQQLEKDRDKLTTDLTNTKNDLIQEQKGPYLNPQDDGFQPLTLPSPGGRGKKWSC